MRKSGFAAGIEDSLVSVLEELPKLVKEAKHSCLNALMAIYVQVQTSRSEPM